MTPETLLRLAIAPAMTLLPPRMDTVEARAMMIAIALQESGLRHRKQVAGPAHGWWQFEPIGVLGVTSHHATQALSESVVDALVEGRQSGHDRTTALYLAVRHNDVLAAAFARLYMWQWPDPLPSRDDGPEAWWQQYIGIWRPGKPKRGTWDEHYATAWSVAGFEV